MRVMGDTLQDVAEVGDGGDTSVSAELLSRLKEDARITARDSSFEQLWQTRVQARNMRLCRWGGQSIDNRKWDKNFGGEAAEPFDGASDLRVRYADMVTNEKVMLSILAMIRGAVRVTPAEGSDVNYAGNLELVRRYLIKSVLRFEWFREWIKLANYVYGETPGVGKMRVVWRRHTEVEYRTVTRDDLAMLYVEARVAEFGEGLDQEALLQEAAELVQAFDGTVEEGALADLLVSFFPFLNRTRARKVARELVQDGEARFPAPFVKFEGPEIRAQSYLAEWVAPSGAPEFQRCDQYFEWEWLSESEVRERRVTEGWSEKFVDELLSNEDSNGARRIHEGQILFREFGLAADGTVTPFGNNRYRGLYQVVHAFVKVANEDNIPGRYQVTFHPEVSVAATDLTLIDYKHGLWPGHVVQREVLSDRMTDSRGIPELASGTQAHLKLHADGLGDYGQISYTPMLRAPRRWEGDDVEMGPLAVLENKGGPQNGDWSWLQPPQFPATAAAVMETVQKFGDEYFGRAQDRPELARLHDEFTVFWWLTQVAEVTKQMLQLAQQYMSDEMLARITNRQGVPMLRSRADIQGQFDVGVSFDPRMLDPAFLEQAGNFLRGTLLAVDRENTVQTSAMVENLMWQFWPEMAEVSLRDVETATQDEIEQERKNYHMILSGEEPPMVADGSQNYNVRLGFYQDLERANPEVYKNLPADRQAMMQARIEHFMAMIEQYGQNAQIGRQGTVSGSQRIQEGGE